MEDRGNIISMLNALEEDVKTLEVKMDDLYMRPRMPFTQNALESQVLTLDANLLPAWE